MHKIHDTGTEYTERTCIIVVETVGRGRAIPMGILVDSVSEVLNITDVYIEETAAFGTKLDTEYMLGMAKSSNSIKILLDIDRVLTVEDIQMV
jgi:purine-binding chemotaxis protein CheW